MAILSRDPDHPLPDIMITVWLIGCCITSTLLNPLMFVYNYKPPHTVQRVIYTILSVLGFIMCLVAPIVTIPNALSSTDCKGNKLEENMSLEDVLKCRRNATDAEKAYSGMCKACVSLPIILTSILTATRLYHIKFPLRKKLRKEILTVTLVICMIPVVFNTLSLMDKRTILLTRSTFLISKVTWWGPSQAALNIDPFSLGGSKAIIWSALLMMVFPFAIQTLGVVASLLTIKQILSKSNDPAARQSQRNNVKVTKKILITNTGSLITSITFTAYLSSILRGLQPGNVIPNLSAGTAWILVMYNLLGPCLIYAVNPVVFIAMTPNFKDGIIKGVRRRSTVNVTRISMAQIARDEKRAKSEIGTSETSTSAMS